MPDSEKNQNEKISVEELLRFKRAERPDQAFWDKFDRELHQRMMQTLVKKDPWPVQILRGLSTRLAQTGAIVGVAAALAVMVVRPAFFATNEAGNFEMAAVDASESVQSEEPGRSFDPVVAQADYATEVVRVSSTGLDSSITPEYRHDDIVLVNYEREAYAADFELPGFAASGVASIVY